MSTTCVSGARAQSGAVAAVSLIRTPVPGAPAGVIAIVDVNVLPMDTNRVLPNHTVLVQQGWITALGPSNAVKVPSGAVQIDGRSKYLLPGFADMHAHLNMSGKTDSARTEYRLLSWWLANGVTTIRVLDWVNGTTDERALRWRARAAAAELLSPRIYTSGLWADSLATAVRANRTKPNEVAQFVAAYKAAGYDFIKVHNQESVEVFDSLVAVARRVGLPIVGHAPLRVGPNDDPLSRALRAGMKSLEHLTGFHQYLYLKHVQPTLPKTSGDPFNSSSFMAPLLQRLDAMQPTIQELATTMQRAGVWNTPTLTIYSKFPNQERMPYMKRLTKALQDAGAGLLLGTDACCGHDITVQDEFEAFVAAGLTPYQALVAGTRNPAVYFGTLDSSGTVAVGKRADLVLLNGNPLQDIKATVHPAGVMLGGRWLSRAEIDRRPLLP